MAESTIWTAPTTPWGQDDQRWIVAVRTGGENTDPKYGWPATNLAGPVRVTPNTARLIDEWAAEALDIYGGYVHLIFFDPDEGPAATAELAAMLEGVER